MRDDPTPGPAPESRFWRALDAVTSTCPLCAFCRGVLLGGTLAYLLVTYV